MQVRNTYPKIEAVVNSPASPVGPKVFCLRILPGTFVETMAALMASCPGGRAMELLALHKHSQLLQFSETIRRTT